MRRARKPMPAVLGDLRINTKTGLYEIAEDGITYSMALEQVRDIRLYFKGFNPGGGMLYATVFRWYKDLDKDTKKKVLRSGKVPSEPIDFYPDTFYE